MRWTFGAHEPLTRYLRVGKKGTGGIDGNARWVKDWLDWFDSDSPALMEELGLNWLHCRFYKGMGWEVEKEDFPNVKRFVDNCHAHGVHALAYVQLNTLYPEIMRHEIPDIESWQAVDAGGHPIVWQSHTYYRTTPCIHCAEWEEYLKEICTIALRDGGFDGIMFDNAYSTTETQYYHQQRWQAFEREASPLAGELLGMPAHRRWVLLALYRGFIGNAMAFEATRRAPTMPWAPRGEYVELVLNGKFQGLYYLCEQIKIDENRVPITKMEKEDVTYPAVSGGYLLEYDELYDEEYKFRSKGFNLPVQLKSPSDSVPDAQFNYIRDYINEMEAEIKKVGKEQSHYADYLDRDNFAEYWMVLETIGNYEAYKPRSVKLYKGRDGVDSPEGTVCKLKAGPLWDQELFEVNHNFNSKDMYYYKYLFRDPEFVAAVKERWEIYKSNILGNDRYAPFLDYLNEIADRIRVSANRDILFWANQYFTLSGEVAVVKGGFRSKINWMDSQIQGF